MSGSCYISGSCRYNSRMIATSVHWAFRGLPLVALLVSAYLTWTTLQQADVVGCGMASVVDCDEVLTSKWSRWFGIPVGMLGLVVYALLFGCSWFLIVDEFEPGRSRYPWMASLALSLTAAASGIWFIGLQAFSIQSFCIYCLAVHVCGIATAILLWLNLPSGDESQDFAQMGAMLGVQAPGAGMGGFADEEWAVLTRSDLYVSTGIAVAGLLVLTIGQFLTSEPESTLGGDGNSQGGCRGVGRRLAK